MLPHRVSKVGGTLAVALFLLALWGNAWAVRASGHGIIRSPARPNLGLGRSHRHRYHRLPSHRQPSRFRRIYRAPQAGHRTFSLRGSRYTYYGGRYHLNTPAGLEPITGPVGATIPRLPVGYVKVKGQSPSYFYHAGTFYRHDAGPEPYVVVDPPIGAKVPSIPTLFTTVYIKGHKYYKVGEVYYQSSYRSGDLLFEVVEPE